MRAMPPRAGRTRRPNTAGAGGGARPRRPWPRGATARCGCRGVGTRAWPSGGSRHLEERERFEAARAVRLAARGGDDGAGDAQTEALAEALGLQHPMREHREARLDAGRAGLVPIEPELARSGRAEFLGEQALLARERLPCDELRRVPGAIDAQHVELLVARDRDSFLRGASRLCGRRAGERIGLRINDHLEIEVDVGPRVEETDRVAREDLEPPAARDAAP